jgi:hypothetical protein
MDFNMITFTHSEVIEAIELALGTAEKQMMRHTMDASNHLEQVAFTHTLNVITGLKKSLNDYFDGVAALRLQRYQLQLKVKATKAQNPFA